MQQPRWRRRRARRPERDAPGPRRQRQRLWPWPGPRVLPGRERSGASPPAGLTRRKTRRPRREEAVRSGESVRRRPPRHHGWAHQKTDPEAPLQVSWSLGRGVQAAVRRRPLGSSLQSGHWRRPRVSHRLQPGDWPHGSLTPWAASPPARRGACRAAGEGGGLGIARNAAPEGALGPLWGGPAPRLKVAWRPPGA